MKKVKRQGVHSDERSKLYIISISERDKRKKGEEHNLKR